VFKDYDPLRKGTVTEDKFRSSLAILGIHLKESDIQKLLVKYKDDKPGLFNYDRFCTFIDE
jgi:Ca2+-binding EF-hand superfamily protein